MGRRYTIAFSNASLAAQQDLFSFKPATDKPVAIVSIHVDNDDIAANAGDAKEQLWGWGIVRGNTTIGSGGSNPTARPVIVSDAAFGPTTNVRVNDTTKVSGGTGVTVWKDGFNTRLGLHYVPLPEERIVTTATDGFCAVQLLTTPSAAIKMSGTLTVEEVA